MLGSPPCVIFTIIKSLHVHKVEMNVPLHQLKVGYTPAVDSQVSSTNPFNLLHHVNEVSINNIDRFMCSPPLNLVLCDNQTNHDNQI